MPNLKEKQQPQRKGDNMAEPTLIAFNFREIAELLVKQQDIHEGLWCIHFKFGIKGANLGTNDENVLPTAMVPILELGLQKVEDRTNLTVDAARVNPRKPPKRKK